VLTVYRVTVELPLAISSDNATYETQFGWVQRPTHKNTTWDMAKVRAPSSSLARAYFFALFLVSGRAVVVGEFRRMVPCVSGVTAVIEVWGQKDAGKTDFLLGLFARLSLLVQTRPKRRHSCIFVLARRCFIFIWDPKALESRYTVLFFCARLSK
jgi:hypothetical protein